jgi:GT2 family glycosyltransferase
MYFEDHDFGLKIRFNGYDILSVPAARVLHREGTPGLSLREHKQYTTVRVYNNIRNRWQIIIKFFSLRSIFILLPILVIYEVFQFAVAVKKGWAQEWFDALLWIMNNANFMYKKRLKLQRNRQIRDREIFKNGLLPFAAELAQTRIEERGIKFLNGISITYWKYAKDFL